jgi:GntR family transcriptional regulator
MPIAPGRSSPLRLYHQIANVLRSRIELHEWEPGEQLPAESALAASFGVSPLTVRQALALLVHEGRLRRQQGRGTFVTEPSEPPAKVRLTAPFHQMMATLPGLELRLLDLQPVRGPSSISGLLGIPAGEEMVRIRRVRMRGERPLSYTVSYVLPRLAALLSQENLEEQPLLISLLERKAGFIFRQAHQTIEAALAAEEVATELQVPVGSPILQVKRQYELVSGGIGFVALNHFPSPSVRYEIRLVRQDQNRRHWQIT